MPPSQNNQNKNKEYCNKFNKEKTKNGPRQKKKKNLKKHKAEKWRDVVRVCGWVDCEGGGVP